MLRELCFTLCCSVLPQEGFYNLLNFFLNKHKDPTKEVLHSTVMLIVNTDCRSPFTSLFYCFFFYLRNKTLFQDTLKIIFFISFSNHIGLVNTKVDTKSIESILVLSLLVDWSFHFALKSCLSEENYCWWPVSNVCSWAGNEHNLSASVNSLQELWLKYSWIQTFLSTDFTSFAF